MANLSFKHQLKILVEISCWILLGYCSKRSWRIIYLGITQRLNTKAMRRDKAKEMKVGTIGKAQAEQQEGSESSESVQKIPKVSLYECCVCVCVCTYDVGKQSKNLFGKSEP